MVRHSALYEWQWAVGSSCGPVACGGGGVRAECLAHAGETPGSHGIKADQLRSGVDPQPNHPPLFGCPLPREASLTDYHRS